MTELRLIFVSLVLIPRPSSFVSRDTNKFCSWPVGSPLLASMSPFFPLPLLDSSHFKYGARSTYHTYFTPLSPFPVVISSSSRPDFFFLITSSIPLIQPFHPILERRWLVHSTTHDHDATLDPHQTAQCCSTEYQCTEVHKSYRTFVVCSESKAESLTPAFSTHTPFFLPPCPPPRSCRSLSLFRNQPGLPANLPSHLTHARGGPGTRLCTYLPCEL